jgi:KDO2-lipid IV(A) lauroyltransferase
MITPMPSERNFWGVKLAPLRLAIAAIAYVSMRSIVYMPFRWQLSAGKRAGAVSRWLLPARRKVVMRNLEVCFPELSESERNHLLKAHFEALGASIIEMAMGWFGSIATLRRLVRVEGVEHLEAALEKGRGVILYSGHFTSFELLFPVLSSLCPRLCGMYKPPRNPVMSWMMHIGRERSFDHQFAKDSVRGMLRELASNSVFWYASDQKYASKGGTLLPFFGEPAMTNTAISRIARISGAVVLPYNSRRLPGDEQYELHIGPPLQAFPSDDPIRDTARLVAILEEDVRRCPAQYWWVHKRFKDRPAPYPDIYRPPIGPVETTRR